MFTQRPVEADDFAKICRVPSTAEELFYMAPTAMFPLSPDALRDIVAQRESPTVLILNGDIAAFASLYFNKIEQTYFIGNVIVAPSHRGKGAAGKLISVMTEIARQRFSIQDIRLSCFNMNTAGLRLYTKLGFIPYAMAERRNTKGEYLVKFDLKCELGKIAPL
jgi:RimJ/RimL family protein N-acetyltransferase